MPLAPGEQLGPYKIVSLIGAGGMGEVYRATDTQLKRDVALKVVLPAFARDPERYARFQREAEVLASLNHPNIATLHGLAENALVMEFVGGETLPCPLPLIAAVPYARQIAEALEYAHERGVIHRDLKPANIKVTPDGAVKLLDFGLAKALDNTPASTSFSDVANSPTLTLGQTMAGQILGTAAYMSPEQVEGRAADRRADIWSFGAVLFEMLAGKRAFEGTTNVETLASVVRLDPDWSALPKETPSALVSLIRRCLTKDRRQRLQAIGEARILLSNPREALAAAPPPAAVAAHAPPRKLPWAIAAACAIAAMALGTMLWAPWRAVPEPPKPVRFPLTPENVTIGSSLRFALSPDGAKLAHAAIGSDGAQRLWVRALDTLESRVLSAADVSGNIPIFWSFDSRFVVFTSAGKLKKIDVSGGPAQTLCDVVGVPVGGSWNRDGVILFGNGTSSPLMRVSSEGGMPAPVTALDVSRAERYHLGPVFLPDGRHFLYSRAGKPESTGVYLGSLDETPERQESKRLMAADYTVEFVPSPDGSSGEILFLREATLFAQPFDLRRLQLAGEPVPIAERVSNFLSVGQFSASKTGSLVYRTGGAAEGLQLTWFDRQGKALGPPSDPGYSQSTVSLSPDGSRVAAERIDGNARNLWLVEFERGGKTRFTYSQTGADRNAVWSPDGTRIAFSSSRTGHFDIYQHAANGAGEDELLLKSDGDKAVTDWSRDGRFLLYDQLDPKTGRDLWVLPMEGTAGERKPIPFLRTEFAEIQGRFSPDGRWIAYGSNESARTEVYVRPFPVPAGGGGRWAVSQGGGREPRWRRDGRELFYLTLGGQLMASEVAVSSAAFQVGVPKPLFKVDINQNISWDVSADGQRFLLPSTGAGELGVAPFTIVLNWMSALKK